MRLRALIDSRVRVPDLADTVGPVSERNCIGAIPPGGEHREENDQAVTPWRSNCHNVNSIRSAVLASLLAKWRSPNEIVLLALREWMASSRKPQMVGDSMVGSQRDVNQGTTVGGDERACRGQSVRSSMEAGNDRGAKGRRKVVGAARLPPSHKGRCSAVRLSASVRGRLAGEQVVGDQWAALEGVSGARACAAGALLPNALRRVPEPAHREPLTGKPDAGNPPVRFGRAGRSPNLLSDLHPRRHAASPTVLRPATDNQEMNQAAPGALFRAARRLRSAA